MNFRAFRIEAKLKSARHHILLAMRFLANPDPLPKMNAREMEMFCKKVMDILWGDKADDLCGAAAALVENVAAGNFNRDNIRTQAFTDKVIASCKKVISDGKVPKW